uniref:Secreted cysteine-rich protein n=1 Tax=Pristhesancus plagipennis TaxID=1955184 RepID=A0A2K8JMJ3_PRIPG|nr:secreted cysteine-rich protein [Pristhesancus plagipennis]
MLKNLLWILIILGTIQNGLFLFYGSDESNASNSSESSSDEGGLFDDLLDDGKIEKPKCGPKDKCPTHNCRFDPAVIHGYCCGCAGASDESPYLCPLDLLCPIKKDELCKQFRYIIKCCCPEGVKDKTN